MDLHILNLRNSQLQEIQEKFKHQLYIDPFLLEKYHFDENSKIIELCDENGKVRAKYGCTLEMWGYKIGSIKIVNHWIKARVFKKLERQFEIQDAWQLMLLMYIVEQTISLTKELNVVENYETL